ncbi:MAG: four helix bundle protein [Patescibacteria group bacterium]
MELKTKSFRELIVWQKSMKLVLEIYNLTKKFPNSEIYGLVSQLRRAVVAIPSNIAEGYLRRHTKEYSQFINVAFASGAELETQLEISKDLKCITVTEYNSVSLLLTEVMKMLNKLSQILRGVVKTNY